MALYEARSLSAPSPHATQTYRPVRHGATIIQGQRPCQGLRPFLPDKFTSAEKQAEINRGALGKVIQTPCN